MNPQERIKDLCQRYGISAAFGERMLPMARRADEVRPELRRRMLAFLERSFAAQVDVEREERRKAATGGGGAGSDEALRAVADVLHRWDPPSWLDRWAERTRRPGRG